MIVQHNHTFMLGNKQNFSVCSLNQSGQVYTNSMGYILKYLLKLKSESYQIHVKCWSGFHLKFQHGFRYVAWIFMGSLQISMFFFLQISYM